MFRLIMIQRVDVARSIGLPGVQSDWQQPAADPAAPLRPLEPDAPHAGHSIGWRLVLVPNRHHSFGSVVNLCNCGLLIGNQFRLSACCALLRKASADSCLMRQMRKRQRESAAIHFWRSILHHQESLASAVVSIEQQVNCKFAAVFPRTPFCHAADDPAHCTTFQLRGNFDIVKAR